MAEKKAKMLETEIAEIAQMFFEQLGWDMYPEVVIPNFNGRPDLVGEKMEMCAVVECKKSLTYPVLEQLSRWQLDWQSAEDCQYQTTEGKGIPHLLIAFTERSRGGNSPLKQELLDRYRLGHYSVDREYHSDDAFHQWHREEDEIGRFTNSAFIYTMQYKNYRWTVREEIAPKIQHGSRRSAHNILKHLNKDMKMGVAGATGKEGAYMTPFKRTMNKVQRVLERGGVWHIHNIVDVINKEMGGHHYSSDSAARRGVSKFIVELGMGEEESLCRYQLTKTKK